MKVKEARMNPKSFESGEVISPRVKNGCEGIPEATVVGITVNPEDKANVVLSKPNGQQKTFEDCPVKGPMVYKVEDGYLWAALRYIRNGKNNLVGFVHRRGIAEPPTETWDAEDDDPIGGGGGGGGGGRPDRPFADDD
jgi:hypothetical protein